VPEDGKILKGDGNASILNGDKEPFKIYIGFMKAVTQKNPLSIGCRLAAGGDERTLRGAIDLSESELETFISCDRDLVK
jgi:hypothetical protein